MTQEDIENSFTYHPPKGTQPERYVLLRDNAKKLANLILTNCPPGAEQTIAIRRVEEAIMWANKAIACGE